jgi:hypothetical protein
MSTRASAWLAWSVCALSLVLTALGFMFLVLNRYHPGVPAFEFAFQSTVIVASCSSVGVLIASRRPAHPIGWLFSAVGLVGGVHFFAASTPYMRWWWSAGHCRAAVCRPGSLAGYGCQ